MSNFLQNFQNKLTNLTGNNRTLWCPKLSKEFDLDLSTLDHVSEKSSHALLSQLIESKSTVSLLPVIDSRDPQSNVLSQRLKKIHRKDLFLQEEKGSFDLHLGFPWIEGKLQDGSLIRAPFFLWPVELKQGSSWTLHPNIGRTPSINRNFLLAYAHYNQKQLSTEVYEGFGEDGFTDLLDFKNQLYAWLKEVDLGINMTQALFEEKLVSFKDISKEDFETEQNAGVLRLKNEAVLGIFPLSNGALWLDYEVLMEHEPALKMEDFFGKTPLAALKREQESHDKNPISEKTKEESIMAPLPIDASQEQTLQNLKKGHSWVVQGPPGTGKSQLICNLLADAMASGKKVLVVCQKKAALDVIHQRLQGLGLDGFVGKVHDHQQDLTAIFEQIAKLIASISEFEKQNQGLDTVWLERSFLQTSRSIDQICETLESFKSALFDETIFGVSAKTLYLSTPKEVVITGLEEWASALPWHQWDRNTQVLHYGWKLQKQLLEKAPFWSGHITAAPISVQDQKWIPEILLKLDQTLKQDRAWLENALHEMVSAQEIWSNLQDIPQLQVWSEKLQQPVLGPMIQLLLTENPSVGKQKQISQQLAFCLKYAQTDLKLIQLGDNSLEEVKGVLLAYQNAHSSWWKSLTWSFSASKKKYQYLLHQNQILEGPSAFGLLEAKLAKYEKYVNNTEALKMSLHWNQEFSSDLETWVQKDEAWKAALKLRSEWDHLSKLSQKMLLQKQFTEFLKRLELLQNDVQRAFSLLSPAAFAFLQKDPDMLAYQAEVWMNHQDLIVEINHWYHEQDLPVQKLITAWFKQIEPVTMEQIKAGVQYHLLQAIEERYPILRSVSLGKIDLLSEELQQLFLQKQSYVKDMVLLKSRERTYANLTFNRLQNAITYRNLEHQVNKKRKRWPLRKLWKEETQSLLQLMPCWLASPETASTIFPLERLFDLVIFDEASQCFAENALPAMYRGAQIMVAGDQHQLPPFDLYKPRWESLEEEDSIESEAHSLLDLAAQYLPQTMLLGHYRSKREELVAFSNQHFYRSKLQIIPHRKDSLKREAPIEVLQVNGVWENQSNVLEAKRIVILLQKIYEQQPHASIAVVTFNAKQQQLILDYIDDAYVFDTLKPTQNVVVKNIEHIQGDEKDIVIFSIAYAPNAAGNMHLHFGTLNIAGGENRLNVAITRAKEKIYVVCSVRPEQLDVDQSKNQGPKLLRAYLEYARQISDGGTLESLKATQPATYSLAGHMAEKNDELLSWYHFSDLTSRSNPMNPILYFTDDQRFYDSPSVKESFAYLPLLLKNKDWTFKRVYSRDFWKGNLVFL